MHLIPRFIQFLSLLIVCFGLIGVVDCQPAFAHRPHDVVTQVELSPTFSQDQTLYIVVRDNLFKSEDQGAHWQRISGIDTPTSLTSLAVSQSDGQVLFATFQGGGVYRSNNGGLSWQAVNDGLSDLDLSLVAIAPETSAVVFAAGQTKGLYKTIDQGASWLPVLPNSRVTSIAFIPASDQMLIGDASGNLYRSDNLGDTWNKTTSIRQAGAIQAIAPVPDSATGDIFIATEKAGVYRAQLGSAAAQPDNRGLTERRMMDLVVTPDAKGDYTVLASSWQDGYWQYRSADKTWMPVNTGLTRDKMADDMKVPHFQDLEVSDAFAADGIAFLGGFDGLFKTADSGANWQELETLSISTVIDFAISPNYVNDSTIAVASYVQGLYLSHDQGKTWEPINNNLFIERFKGNREEKGEEGQDPRRFFDIAFSPNYASDHSLFTGVLWSKFLRSSNQGQDWSVLNLSREVRGVSMVLSPNFAVDQTIFLGNQQGIIFQSTDGGRSFQELSRIDKQSGNNSPAFAISPNFADDQTLFVSSAQGVYQSVDRGKSWQVLTANTLLKDAKNIQLVISPDYQTDHTLLVSFDKGIYITTDQGNTWRALTNSVLGDQPYVEAIAISPNYASDKTFVVSIRGQGLVRTQDGGQSFVALGNQPLSLSKIHGIPSAGLAVQFSPNYAFDQTLYGFGSASSELFKSTDAGNTWQTLSIPRQEIGNPNVWQSVILQLSLHRGKLIKLSVACIGAGIGYLVYLYVRLGKKRSFAKTRVASP